MAPASEQSHRKSVIGNPKNFWLHSSRHARFDLTYPPSPTAAPISPRLDLRTTATPITLDPKKTALVIIDMQNFFLSESFGRKKGAGHAAAEKLQKYAIPAARKAGIQVLWLNWGLSDADVESMPPAIKRAFGFEAVVDSEGEVGAMTESGDVFRERDDGMGVDKDGHPRHQGGDKLLENGKDGRIYKGLGSQCGVVKLEDGTEIDAGRLLMRDSWNAALWPPLDALYEEGSNLSNKPDVWIHKDRMSGLWGASTACEDFLKSQGIRSLLFTESTPNPNHKQQNAELILLQGVNTDQCVSGTLTDAFSKGYDCIMLSDGCGTTSPDYSQQCIEFNAGKTWGFVASCEDLFQGVERMES